MVDACIHELARDLCGFCRPGQRQARRRAREPGPVTIMAARTSHCPSCEERIAPGDRITLVDTDWLCAGCAADTLAEEAM
jgi:hypothetical protein